MSSEKHHLHTFGAVKVYGCAGDNRTFFYKSTMGVDADGAPNAYGPHNSGLDWTRNAGHPGHWTSIVTDNGKPGGKPVLQGRSDPFPGLYISTTALVDPSVNSERDLSRYVNASDIPYVSMTGAAFHWAYEAPPHGRGLRKGDLAYVYYRGNSASAILAEVGGSELGEGSIALAKLLGGSGNPRSGTLPRHVIFILFPGSGDGIPLSAADIQTRGQAAFRAWGGLSRLCLLFPEEVPVGDFVLTPGIASMA